MGCHRKNQVELYLKPSSSVIPDEGNCHELPLQSENCGGTPLLLLLLSASSSRFFFEAKRRLNVRYHLLHVVFFGAGTLIRHVASVITKLTSKYRQSLVHVSNTSRHLLLKTQNKKEEWTDHKLCRGLCCASEPTCNSIVSLSS